MNYIIDGHNLIANLPGLDLSLPDDEERLVGLLNRFGEVRRGKLEVYFDGAPAGQAGRRNFGRVVAYFVVASSSADQAIKARLAYLAKSAPSWTVVTSDRSVQAAAHEAHARVMSSGDFSSMVQQSFQERLGEGRASHDQPLTPAEVDEWLNIFKQRKSTK